MNGVKGGQSETRRETLGGEKVRTREQANARVVK